MSGAIPHWSKDLLQPPLYSRHCSEPCAFTLPVTCPQRCACYTDRHMDGVGQETCPRPIAGKWWDPAPNQNDTPAGQPWMWEQVPLTRPKRSGELRAPGRAGVGTVARCQSPQHRPREPWGQSRYTNRSLTPASTSLGRPFLLPQTGDAEVRPLLWSSPVPKGRGG